MEINQEITTSKHNVAVETNSSSQTDKHGEDFEQKMESRVRVGPWLQHWGRELHRTAIQPVAGCRKEELKIQRQIWLIFLRQGRRQSRQSTMGSIQAVLSGDENADNLNRGLQVLK
jgi:hypothetical protein